MTSQFDTGPSKVIDSTSLVTDLVRARRRLGPDFQVVIDAIAYLVVSVDHLLMHVHDEEIETH